MAKSCSGTVDKREMSFTSRRSNHVCSVLNPVSSSMVGPKNKAEFGVTH